MPRHVSKSDKMNELPLIGSLFIRKGFRDRKGANIASRCKKMYGENLFDVQKTILERDQRFFRHRFIRNRFGQCL